MTSKLKCPFCQTELEQMHDKKMLGCSKCLHIADGVFWAKVIQAKQDLEQYKHKDNLQQQLNANNNQIQENYKQIVEIDGRIIENLEKDLEIARKALKDITKEHCAFADWVFKAVTMTGIAEKALEQIDHFADTNKGQKNERKLEKS